MTKPDNPGQGQAPQRREMGDRANILVKEDSDDGGVYLYSHWGGTELPLALQNALKKKWRWDDCAYLTRIIFDTMSMGCHGDETGCGISARVGDGGDRILIVEVERQQVRNEQGVAHWTFSEYIELTPEQIKKVWA